VDLLIVWPDGEQRRALPIGGIDPLARDHRQLVLSEHRGQRIGALTAVAKCRVRRSDSRPRSRP